MAYIGQSPAEKGIGLFSQDTFTGDGSTTTFDMSNVAPDGGGNDIQVFVDNVRQQEGSSNAYTLGNDGSGDLKRITFTTAPGSGQSIFVLNPGTKNVQQISTVSDNAVTSAKIQANAVTVAKLASTLDLSSNTVTLPNDVVNADKIADDAVSEEHLDNTAITGHAELAATAADDDVLLIFDTDAGAIKKIQRSNVSLAAPTFTSVSPTNINTGDGTGNATFTITGTNFTTGSTANLINTSGSTVNFDTVTRNSTTQITGVIAISSLPNSGEPYDVKVINGENLAVISENQINVNAQPVYVTAAGTLGTVADGGRSGLRFTVVATDPESAGNVTFEKQSGTIPPGLTLSNEGSEGGTAVISGNASAVTSDTTFNFTLRAIDAASNTSSRAFSITIQAPPYQTFTSSGTFSVPSGTSTLNSVLVVAGGGSGGRANAGNTGGGGGGAGGLVYFPNYPVSPGGTITVTVGCGAATTPDGTGSGQPSGSLGGADSKFGAPGDPGFSPTSSVLTAKGGGGGGNESTSGSAGGSGGGTGYNNSAGGATQPTQPGNSGAYGFGNAGANGASQNGASIDTGGGGGAGGAGQGGGPGSPGTGGNGGVGKAYSITGSPVYYAGGGGGGGESTNGGGVGGQGGGGDGGDSQSVGAPGSRTGGGNVGSANKGGGGGGGGRAGSPCAGPGGGGGKGVVIVKY